MKLKKILESLQAIDELGKLVIPSELRYKIKKLMKQINAEVENFNETRDELIKQYGEINPATQQPWIPNGSKNLPYFNKDIEELVNTEIEIKIPEMTVKDIEKYDFSSKSELQLDWLIKE